uniref:Uncharacterized protein n=1 Tax=Wuchereria bancrofti TaxID=6293 RepID=A0A1I8EQ87_WUCBA
MTNVSDIRDECNTVEKYVAVILFSLLLLYGTVSNVLLMVVFCSHDNLYSHSFVLIASQIIFPGSRQYYYMIFSAAVLPTTNLILIKRFRESLKRVFLELLSKIKIVKGISTVVLTTSIAMRKIHLISHMR